MLYPTFDELVGFKHKVSRFSVLSDQATVLSAKGGYTSPFRGKGLEFEEVRPYAPGDDIRTIDWRVTARTGTPHTKIFREERERSVILCIDVNRTMRFGTRGTFKSIQAARVAAGIAWQAHLSQNKLGACLFGDVSEGFHFLAPHGSRKTLWALFKELSLKDFNEEASPVLLREILPHLNHITPTGALVYIISDFHYVDKALEKQLRYLRKRAKIILIPIDDLADQFIPPLGSLFFSANDQDILCIDTNDKADREAYATQWQITRQALQEIARKLKISMIPIATDADAPSNLLFGLKQIQKGRSR